MSLEKFFNDFQRYSNEGDLASLATCFADSFVVATPEGQQMILARDFVGAMAKRKQQFEDMGASKSELVSLEERQLGDSYRLADTQWRFGFANVDGGKEVTARSTFLVHMTDEPRIVLYLPHGDVVKTMGQTKPQS